MDDSVIVKTVLNGPAGFMATNISQPILGGSITFTSTAIISSFGQTQSGVYSCTATLHSDSTLTNAYNNTSGSAAVDYTRVTTGEILLCFSDKLGYISGNFFTGVYLAMTSHFIANNTQINIRSIGLSSDNPDGALHCITDKNPDSTHGEWYFPNRVLISESSSENDSMFYRSGGNGCDGEISLNRPRNVTSPTGQFCCEVPDATDIIQTLCVIIGKPERSTHSTL